MRHLMMYGSQAGKLGGYGVRLPLTRFFGPVLTSLGLFALGYLLISGRIDFTKLAGGLTGDDADPLVEQIAPPANKPENLISIATFHVQFFGEAKAGTADVMDDLARVCKLFDVIAVQNVRSPAARPVERLVERINADGSRYAATVGRPLGRSASRDEHQQYAFIYDATRVRLDEDRVYVMSDDEDRMHREPMVASFVAIPTGVEDRRPFSFTLINVDTDPAHVLSGSSRENELDVLADVYANVRQWEYSRYGEDDFILLGTLNAATDQFGRLGRNAGLRSIAGTQPTETAGTETRDHLLVDLNTTGEFTRAAGVLDYARDLGVDQQQAVRISDHRPVWAQFSSFELPAPSGPVATTSATTSQR